MHNYSTKELAKIRQKTMRAIRWADFERSWQGEALACIAFVILLAEIMALAVMLG